MTTRIVFASSRAVYARAEDAPVPETHPTLPATPYGVSKWAVEQLLDFESPLGILGATTLRCFNVSGGAPGISDPDTHRLVPRLIGALAETLPPVRVGSPGHRRDFVHVVDVARAFVAALDGTEPGRHRVYNVGTGTGTSVGEVAALLERVAGRRLPRDETVADDGPDADAGVADISLIRRDLGWAPILSVEEVLDDAWFHSPHAAPDRSDRCDA